MYSILYLSIALCVLIIALFIFSRSESFTNDSDLGNLVKACGIAEVHVISLKSSDSRQKIKNMFDNYKIQFSFFDAVNGKEFPNDFSKHIVYSMNNPNMILSNKQVGCALSHIQLWKRCARNNKTMLIFEEDAIILDKFKSDLEQIEKWSKKDGPDNIPQYDIIYFGHCYESKGHNVVMNNFTESVNPLCTHAYLITPRCAKLFLSKCLPLSAPIDNMMSLILQNDPSINAFSSHPHSVKQPWQN